MLPSPHFHQWDKTHPSPSVLPRATGHERGPLVTSGSQNDWFCRAQKKFGRTGTSLSCEEKAYNPRTGCEGGCGGMTPEEEKLKKGRTLHWGGRRREELGKRFLNYVPLYIYVFLLGSQDAEVLSSVLRTSMAEPLGWSSLGMSSLPIYHHVLYKYHDKKKTGKDLIRK